MATKFPILLDFECKGTNKRGQYKRKTHFCFNAERKAKGLSVQVTKEALEAAADSNGGLTEAPYLFP